MKLIEIPFGERSSVSLGAVVRKILVLCVWLFLCVVVVAGCCARSSAVFKGRYVLFSVAFVRWEASECCQLA